MTVEAVHYRLHGVHADGRVVEGMAAICAAWSAAGLGWSMAPTCWPMLRWLFGRKRCDGDRCAV